MIRLGTREYEELGTPTVPIAESAGQKKNSKIKVESAEHRDSVRVRVLVYVGSHEERRQSEIERICEIGGVKVREWWSGESTEKIALTCAR